MGLPEQRVPEPIGSVDIRTLPLTALDGFVFSRIDGRATVADIVAMTGLPSEQVHESLNKLAELGALRFREPPAPASSSARPSMPQPSSSQPPRLSLPPMPPRASAAPPSISSLPPRRRPSYGHTPRRLLSESAISSPPPDMRSYPPRPSIHPGRPRTPPPGSGRPRTPATGPGGSRERPSSDYRSVPPLEGPENATPAPPRPSQVELDRSIAQLTDSSMSFATPAPASLYDPRELEEEVALPIERRKQILELYYRHKELDYYALLGVQNSATKAEIRSAYFRLSKAFHPDSMFRKELGSYKAKMTTVFQALTEAYDTLSKKKSREEYDGYQRATRSTQDAERALAIEPREQDPSAFEVPRPPALPSTGYELPEPTPVPAPPREASPESRRLARELIARRLRGLAPRSGSPQGAPASGQAGAALPTGPESGSAPPLDRQAIAKSLTRALIDVAKVSGSSGKLGRALAETRAAIERGEIAAAVQNMARAVALAPDRADLQAEYESLSRVLATKLADDYAEQASFEQKHGKWAAAASSWAKVCEGRPDDSHAQRSTALALLKAGGDLRSAQQYAQRAVFLAPNDVDARVLLAQAYLTVGLKLNARRELDAAAKLDPENEMVKNLLSELKA